MMAEPLGSADFSPFPLDVVVGPDGVVISFSRDPDLTEIQTAIDAALIEMGVTDPGSCSGDL